MASDAAIKLAKIPNYYPGLVFDLSKSKKLELSIDKLSALLDMRTGNLAEFFDVGFECKKLLDCLGLEMEAFDYWVTQNSELIKKWEAGDSDSESSRSIVWPTIKRISDSKRNTLMRMGRVFEHLKYYHVILVN